MKNFTITLLCLCGIAIHTDAQILSATFDADGSESGWEGLNDAASGLESSIDWNSNGNPTGALEVSATNTEAAGKAYIFQEEYTSLDYGGATDVNLSFDLKLDGDLIGTAIQLQVEIPGTGVVNDSNLENDGLNGTTWTNYSFDYASVMSGATTFRIHFNLANGGVDQGGTLLIDNIVVTDISPPTCTPEAEFNIDPGLGSLNVTFKDGLDGGFEAFGNIGAAVVDNPYEDMDNSSCSVLQVTKTVGCQTWSGVGTELPTAIDLSNSTLKQITMMVYAETEANDITIQLERLPFPDTDPVVAVTQPVTAIGEWQELTFDFSGHDEKTFKSFIIYPERDVACDGDVYYFDDIQLDLLGTDATLSDLQIDGMTVDGFASSTFDYDVELPFGTTDAPMVTGITTHGAATVDVTDAGSIPGTTTIEVTAENGIETETYSISFTAAVCDLETDFNIDPGLGSLNVTFQDGLDGGLAAFGDIASSVVTNPFVDTDNSSCSVLQVTKTPGCQTWSGLGGELLSEIDFSNSTLKQITMMVYAETEANDITIQLERLPFPDIDPAVAITQPVTAIGEWQELTFDFSGHDEKTFKSFIIYPERDAACDGDVYYFDNIQLDLVGTDATLSDLQVDDVTVTGFTSGTLDYSVELPFGTTEVPEVTAFTTDAEANAVVSDAGALPGVTNIVVTAENGVEMESYSINFTVSTTEPITLSEFIVGSWGLKPAAGAFRIGNAGAGSGNFFTSLLGDVTIRDCLFNDLFVFNEDGSFEVNLQGDWWGDTEVGVSPAQCIDESALAGVYADFQSSDDYTYSVSGDEMITVNGSGAFIGLAKAYNGGEYDGADDALETSVTYEVLSFDSAPDSKELVISINVGGINFWTFELIPQEEPPSLDGFTLVWSDEFDSESEAEVINSDNWFHQTQFPQAGGWFNDEEQHYTNRIDNSFMQDNAMQIVAKSETFDDGQGSKDYTSARLNSKFSFTYGRVDVRAVMPTGKGTWPAIWTLGTNVNETGGYWNDGVDQVDWPVSGEIDIMEHWGDDQDVIHGSTHTPRSSGGTENTGTVTAFDVSDIFHIYSIIWDENEIQFLVDNEEYYTYNPVDQYGAKITDPEDPNMNWPFDLPQYLILNVAMGGIFQGPLPHEIDPAFESSAMVIDYVRVYQTDPVTQTIDFAEIGDKAFGDLPFAPEATASSGLPVEFSVKSGPIGFSNGLVRINGIGEAVITASQAGNEEFPPVEVDQTFTINKASQVITFTEISDKTLDDSGFEIEVKSSSGLPVSLEVTNSPDLLIVDIVDNESVSLIPLADGALGSVSITASQAGNDNYLAAENVVESFDIVAFLVSGIEDKLKVELSLYPNPAQESIRLSVPKDDSGTNISVNILDLTGQSLIDLVFDRNVSDPEIDISTLPVGTYILQVTMGDTYGYGKFIKAN